MPGKDVDDFDWIFDAALQVLEGEAFDCAVMNFVDEHCEVFDSLEEENKLEYSEVHRQFVEHVEAIIMSECEEMVRCPPPVPNCCD